MTNSARKALIAALKRKRILLAQSSTRITEMEPVLFSEKQEVKRLREEIDELEVDLQLKPGQDPFDTE